jgi:hypothetical protein
VQIASIHQSANSQNAHYPFSCCRQNVQRHFRADVLERFDLEAEAPIQEFIVPKGAP